MTDHRPPESGLSKLNASLLSLNEDSRLDTVLMVRENILWVKHAAAQLLKDLDNDVLIPWINKNGDMDIGNGNRLYVGDKTTTKCIDKAITLDEILNANGGDMGKAVDCMVSQPFKPAACKKALGKEAGEQCFVTEKVPDVKTGKIKKVIKEANPRFGSK